MLKMKPEDPLCTYIYSIKIWRLEGVCKTQTNYFATFNVQIKKDFTLSLKRFPLKHATKLNYCYKKNTLQRTQ